MTMTKSHKKSRHKTNTTKNIAMKTLLLFALLVEAVSSGTLLEMFGGRSRAEPLSRAPGGGGARLAQFHQLQSDCIRAEQ
mmetsp:Transcript_9646/g.26699  ORF Transcript_9646/g.26699 Transcript_9646/m.26699 type:complete len:80 (+) Transcript_9646:90-329(+)